MNFIHRTTRCSCRGGDEADFYFSFQNHHQFDAFIVECAVSKVRSWPAYSLPLLVLDDVPKDVIRFRIGKLFPGSEKQEKWWLIGNDPRFFPGDYANMEQVVSMANAQERIIFQLEDCINKINHHVLAFLREKYGFVDPTVVKTIVT